MNKEEIKAAIRSHGWTGSLSLSKPDLERLLWELDTDREPRVPRDMVETRSVGSLKFRCPECQRVYVSPINITQAICTAHMSGRRYVMKPIKEEVQP